MKLPSVGYPLVDQDQARPIIVEQLTQCVARAGAILVIGREPRKVHNIGKFCDLAGGFGLIATIEVPIGTISPRLYGHFAEHLARCCYDGLWVGTDESAIPQDGGFRTDVGRVGTQMLHCEDTEFCIRARQRWPDAVLLQRIILPDHTEVAIEPPATASSCSFELTGVPPVGFEPTLDGF